MSLRQKALDLFEREFGSPARRTVKVIEWRLKPDLSAVVQVDQPSNGEYALIWLPYPDDGATVPEIALEYPGEAGRHSNTYPAPGLGRGLPALRLKVSSLSELDDSLEYIRAMRESRALPEVKPSPTSAPQAPSPSANGETSDRQIGAIGFREPKPPAPRREAIPRAVQREVWQRDAGKCVECGTREKLCFDHIVPFSRGGSNTVRNVQLLCEHCNSSKGNRI